MVKKKIKRYIIKIEATNFVHEIMKAQFKGIVKALESLYVDNKKGMKDIDLQIREIVKDDNKTIHN